MIKPLTLKNQTFPINLIYGPLAGISCAAFRLLCWQYGQPAFACTEMISCKALKYKTKNAYQRYTERDPKEGPVCFQLFGSDPKDLAEATKMVTDFGANLIDLNCGCPVKKVRAQHAGSSLLTDPATLYKLILAMKQNTHLPVSVKIRVEGNSPEKFNTELAQVITEAGADFLVVHGRHWNEHYDKPVHYDQIKFFVEAMKIPVIGNGDVACIDSLKKMFATGCTGVMIARAAIGQPWLIKKLVAEMNNETFITPSIEAVGQIFLEHIDLLIKTTGHEKSAILQARKIARNYSRSIKNRAGFCTEINVCEKYEDFRELCKKYFGINA